MLIVINIILCLINLVLSGANKNWHSAVGWGVGTIAFIAHLL